MPVQQPLLDIPVLVDVHARKRLRLAFTRGLEGYVDLNGDPHAVVDELLRLARLGQHCEQTALDHPTRMLSHAVDEALK